jgi:hypothetical protein
MRLRCAKEGVDDEIPAALMQGLVDLGLDLWVDAYP